MMSTTPHPRREFLKRCVKTAAVLAAFPAHGSPRKKKDDALHIACNQYSGHVFYQREGKNFKNSLDAGLRDYAASGLNGIEPSFDSVEDIERLRPLLDKHGLEMRSFYANSELHEAAQAGQSMAKVVALAAQAKRLGASLVVTNPSPIAWGGTQNKTDAQLVVQRNALNELGAKLKTFGMTLSYHNHDMEMREAAREFHHMMVGTNPKLVTLCLDSHWIYRGAGNSSVALFDIVKLYGNRITELHIRQSNNHIWSETFGPGDIDYERLTQALVRLDLRPHLVLEQAVENGTPNTLNTVQALAQSTAYARRVFKTLS